MAFLDRLKSHGKTPAPNDLGSKILRDDKALRSKLQETNKKIPRYLFRMWHAGSGGNKKLNTTERITPLAFNEKTCHKSVYDMSAHEFVDNTRSHLYGDRVATEFSSWSASPRFVLHYATHERKDAYIAIIDTLGLRRDNKNDMFYVPTLAPIFDNLGLARVPNYSAYDWEFLVHGVVEGRHYKAVSFKSLCDAGLVDYLPTLETYVDAWGTDRLALPTPIAPFSKAELEDLDGIAKLFGPPSSMRSAIFIALFCCKKRAGFGNKLKEHELKEIVQYLGGRVNIPHDWSDSLLLCSSMPDLCYEDNRQMVNVMRALSTYCWGRGARARFAKGVDVSTPDAVTDSPLGEMSLVDIERPVKPGAGNVAGRE
ncbi:hypothetical protein QM012_000051 [Aureobasidium pullulans]|uniref:DUF7587 domain-containing protein n=1 Tax=Aureobasidium pullulans TaxID=5580 RepID=A0ABR0TUL7_AURPU